jgi:hypothetical protein
MSGLRLLYTSHFTSPLRPTQGRSTERIGSPAVWSRVSPSGLGSRPQHGDGSGSRLRAASPPELARSRPPCIPEWMTGTIVLCPVLASQSSTLVGAAPPSHRRGRSRDHQRLCAWGRRLGARTELGVVRRCGSTTQPNRPCCAQLQAVALRWLLDILNTPNVPYQPAHCSSAVVWTGARGPDWRARFRRGVQCALPAVLLWVGDCAYASLLATRREVRTVPRRSRSAVAATAVAALARRPPCSGRCCDEGARPPQGPSLREGPAVRTA